MGTNNMMFTIDEPMEEQLITLRNNGLKKGAYCGWESLYEYYSLKEGSTTYIVAPPAVGKTSIISELTMNLSEYEGWKWVIFSPEVGSPKDLFAELLWVKLRKPFLKYDKNKDAKEDEVKAAIKFVKEHFFIIDPIHSELNEHVYFKTIRDIQDKYNVKINGTVIDPVTDFDISGNQRDLALGRFLTSIRKFSSSYGIHSILAFHTKNMGYVTGKTIDGEERRYLPPATMFDVAGGEMASRKGMFILSLWRPPYGIIDPETNLPYPTNETRVNILKAKPKSIGKIGTIKLYYDALSSRYYELNGDNKVYSHPQANSIIEKEYKQLTIE